MTCIIYIHIGNILPEYIYDSIYQLIIFNKYNKIYILLEDNLIEQFNKVINEFNHDLYSDMYFSSFIQTVPLSILQLPNSILNIIDKIPDNKKQFRDNFWINTFLRFFYIEQFMKLFSIQNAFHIENDVMVYENLYLIENNLNKNNLYFLKDSPNRVIPSIVYLHKKHLNELNNYIIEQLNYNIHLNDMDLLGNYFNDTVCYFECDIDYNNTNYIFDGASIGQFLGGIDPRNIKDFSNLNNDEKLLIQFNNPTKSFVNETSILKVNKYKILEKAFFTSDLYISLRLYYLLNNINNIKQIVNTHIHSKELYQYSSIFNIQFDDIITGDRIITLCDYVILTKDIYNYHQNLEKYISPDNIIIIDNFSNINSKNLNNILREKNKKYIKLFIYTHLLSLFITFILPILDEDIKLVLYLHNSDHGLNQLEYNYLCNNNNIIKVYSQNINCIYDSKFTLLPIGLANSMFSHGNLLYLYSAMKNTYKFNKSKNLYVNINPKTFSYRQTILDNLKKYSFNITTQSKSFDKYLIELSEHYFSLCVRGNGLCTHRFWESLYLGVIPVIINNNYTNMTNFVNYLNNLNIPFYEIKDEDFSKYSDKFFNKDLYKKILKKYQTSLYNISELKISFYDYIEDDLEN